MKYLLLLLLFLPLSLHAEVKETDAGLKAELDAYWAEISRAVKTGDFEAYKATCHPEAVLVSGNKKQSYPLAKALVRWKKEFDDTKSGDRKSSAKFRFSHRYHDATTAHETGMLLYEFSTKDGKAGKEYVFLEALLVKREGKWLIMMEYQKATGTVDDWEKL
jgi:hypothetical protein